MRGVNDLRLGQVQENFSLALGELIIYASANGIKMRLKDLLRCDNCEHGSKLSVHRLGLAIDIRLTVKNGLVPDDDDYYYDFLHSFWEQLGGAPRIEDDLGHFSFSWEGRW